MDWTISPINIWLSSKAYRLIEGGFENSCCLKDVRFWALQFYYYYHTIDIKYPRVIYTLTIPVWNGITLEIRIYLSPHKAHTCVILNSMLLFVEQQTQFNECECWISQKSVKSIFASVKIVCEELYRHRCYLVLFLLETDDQHITMSIVFFECTLF